VPGAVEQRRLYSEPLLNADRHGSVLARPHCSVCRWRACMRPACRMLAQVDLHCGVWKKLVVIDCTRGPIKVFDLPSPESVFTPETTSLVHKTSCHHMWKYRGRAGVGLREGRMAKQRAQGRSTLYVPRRARGGALAWSDASSTHA